MTNMQWTCWVCTYVLYLNRIARTQWLNTILSASIQNGFQRIVHHIGFQKEINKTCASNLSTFKPIKIHMTNQSFSNSSRILTSYTSGLHSDVCRKITEFLLRWHFENDFWIFPSRQITAVNRIL